MICAFPDGLKVNHWYHREHVLTFEKVVKQSDKRRVCGLCLDEITAQSPPHYSCRRCDVFLHKVCFEAPLEVTHSSHSLHPLQLTRNPSPNEDGICNACGDMLNSLVYDCDLCNEVTIHVRCSGLNMKPDYSAFPGGKKLDHICHPHILTFEEVVKRVEEPLVCAACLGDISGPVVDYCSCRKCNFFLHKSCAERPLELIHSSHPEHTLQLLQKDPYKRETAVCDYCVKPMKGFVYHCGQCNSFDLDFKCAFSKPEKRIQILEHVHDHPLTLSSRTSKVRCDLCSSTVDEGEEEQSYACSTCDFVIHKSCGLTKLAQRYKDHKPPLSLVQGVPEDLQIYGTFFCDVCYNAITPKDSVGHCARCRSFVHVTCMITGETDLISTIRDAVDYLDNSLIQLILSGEEFIHWPQSDVSSELIEPFLLEKNGIVMNPQPKISHFSHEEHDMILCKELSVNNDSFFKEEDEEILCDGCNNPITAPYYCCQDCGYYLHLPCANLPFDISHFSHPHHELELTNHSRCYFSSKCDRCKQDCNGFTYSCKTCNFCLDLTCAALPAVIMHESHEHPLIQTKEECEGIYHCCKSYGSDDAGDIFKCKSCEVYWHNSCVMLSRSIRHRWDRQHPLDLRYPPHADHPDHIMCDMCEELINPMRWLYSCFQCRVSFHTQCAPKYQLYPKINIKYGRKMKMSFHPHILKHLQKATLKITCDKCKFRFGQYQPVFECETCYDCICYSCVVREENWLKFRESEEWMD